MSSTTHPTIRTPRSDNAVWSLASHCCILPSWLDWRTLQRLLLPITQEDHKSQVLLRTVCSRSCLDQKPVCGRLPEGSRVHVQERHLHGLSENIVKYQEGGDAVLGDLSSAQDGASKIVQLQNKLLMLHGDFDGESMMLSKKLSTLLPLWQGAFLPAMLNLWTNKRDTRWVL